MEYSQANAALWNPIVQFGIIAILILFANVLRRKLPFIRKTLMPTAVLAGFLMLIIQETGLLNLDVYFMEMLTYHMLGVGFIALTLRIPEKGSASGGLIGSKSGALIVSTYLVQAITGLVVTIGLAYTVMPDLFKAGGILLPMAYGQGPG
ncbi:MAG: sodium:glutamate symporter, partial [Firmicutes bacterium]|nr:sodium:glutamate symporter [Bacillota bacterium]